MRRVADALLAVAGVAVLVAGLMMLTIGLQRAGVLAPATDARHEPAPTVGAAVQTPHGPGVITAEVVYGDGPRWQVRLDSGRHVVLYRAEMEVRR